MTVCAVVHFLANLICFSGRVAPCHEGMTHYHHSHGILRLNHIVEGTIDGLKDLPEELPEGLSGDMLDDRLDTYYYCDSQSPPDVSSCLVYITDNHPLLGNISIPVGTTVVGEEDKMNFQFLVGSDFENVTVPAGETVESCRMLVSLSNVMLCYNITVDRGSEGELISRPSVALVIMEAFTAPVGMPRYVYKAGVLQVFDLPDEFSGLMLDEQALWELYTRLEDKEVLEKS